MITCPNCDYEISSEFFCCDYGCDSTEIWWCDNCGSVAICYNGNEPEEDDWVVPERG